MTLGHLVHTPQPLTPNEKKVLEFIETFVRAQGFAPSYQEIKFHFGFASFNSVQRYLKQLEKKQYLFIPGENKKRALRILHPADTIQRSLRPPLREGPAVEALSIPLLGRVAAGQPIEEHEHDETFEVPSSLVRNPQKTFALRVKGQSMVEDGILDGDVLLVQKQDHADNGDIVVALIENEATVKHYYLHTNAKGTFSPRADLLERERHPLQDVTVELRPANSRMKSMWFHRTEVKIEGIMVGLIRKV